MGASGLRYNLVGLDDLLLSTLDFLTFVNVTILCQWNYNSQKHSWLLRDCVSSTWHKLNQNDILSFPLILELIMSIIICYVPSNCLAVT